MRKYSLAYYLLCFLLVAGAFAAMAQNDYGIKILGGVAIAFSLLFAMQFVQEFRKDKIAALSLLECGSLMIMSSILAMRAYFIRFQFVELLFGVAGFILIVVYSITLYQLRNEIRNINKILLLLVFMFYGSLIFYVLSMVLVPLMPDFAEPIGGVAFALLLSFFLFGYLKKELVAGDEKVSAFRYVLKFKDRSIVLLTLFVLFTAYMGLTKVGVLPTMYSDEYPQAYFELVKQAEGGNEKPVNGKYKHEEFKEMYDAFVSRNSMSNQK
jgi:hypothetical protein